MKKHLFSALCLLMLCIGIKAQTNLANYTFTKTVGTYVPLASPTILGTATTNSGATSLDDVNYTVAFPAGFTFNFGGVSQSTLNVNTNGFVGFSTAIWTTSGGYTPLSASPTGGTTNGMISAFGRDLNGYFVTGTVGEISWELVGSAPSREFVIQYKNFRPYTTTAVVGPLLNFQIRLFESTHTASPNRISFSYGNCLISTATVVNTQVGIRGNSTTWADNINSLMIGNIPAATTCDWTNVVTSNLSTSSSIFTSANTSVSIPNGLNFTWSPPTVAIAPVRIFSAVTAISQTSATIGWTAPSGATQYNVQYRIPGTCAWTNFPGNPVMTNSVALTGLTQSTNYQVRVQSSDGTNTAIWSHIPDLAGTGDGYTANGTFKTLDPPCPAPTAQPTGLAFGSVTSTSVGATYAASSPTVTNYLIVRTLGTAPNTPTNGVTYTTGASAALNGTVVSVGTGTTISNTGLAGNTNYTYYIYAYNSTGTCSPVYLGTAPLTGSITTCPALATAITSTLVTSNSFNLTWTASAGGTALPITYSVEVSSNAGFTAPVAGSPFLVVSPTTSLSVTGLNIATTYYYRITAHNGCNIGATTSANVTTSSIPTDLQAVQLIGPAVSNTGCYGSSIPVIVQIKNAGSSVLDFSTNNATVITSVTGTNPQSFTTSIATGTLAAGATQNVTVTATYNMSAIGNYSINATATLATPDANPSNNAIPEAVRTNTNTSIPIINPFTGFTGANLAAVFPLWSEATGSLVPSGTTSAWGNQTGLNGTGNITAKINLYTTTRNEWILTPKFTVASGVNMTFDAAVTGFGVLIPDDSNAMNGTDDKVEVMISTDCGASFTSLLTINQSYSLTPAFQSFSVSLVPYVGQDVIVGFKATDGPIDNLNDYDFHIDNVNINTCFPPSAVTTTNTTTNSVDLSWTAPPFGNPNYVYEIRTSGAAGSGATGLVTTGTVTAPSTSVTATGLSITTSYSVYVRSDCGGGNASTWAPVKTFTTPAACPATSTPTITTLAGYSAVAAWTAGATETLWDVYYGPTPLTAPTATTVPTATVSTTPSYTMAPLTPTTGYAVYVRANCGAGNVSAWSAVRNFTTTVSCPAPSTLTVSAITPTTAVATWTAGGVETNWFVRYSAPTTTVMASGTPSYTMTGLTPSTSYSVQVRAVCGAGDTSLYTPLVTFMTPCLPPNITGTTPGSRCGIGTVTLGATADPGATIQWYTAPTGGTAVTTGSVFTTPTITNTINYYVTASGGMSLYSVGSPSTTGAQGTNTGGHLIFDVLTPLTLNSVVIYPGGTGAGSVVIALQNSAGTTLQTATIAATGAATAIPQLATLNFAITPGTGYRLTYLSSTGGVTSMYRELTGTVYPFTVPGIVSITNSSLGAGYYYFFYNWQVSTGCESARTAVTASVTAPPALALTGSVTACANVISTVSVTSTASNYDNYVWSPVTNLYTDAAATIPYAGGSATTLYYKSAVAGSTVYNVNATNSGSGCANTASTTLNTSVPMINASATPSVICSGAAVTLSATTNVIGAGTAAIGTATTLTAATAQPTAFCNRWTSYRMQTVYTAAELNAAGLSAGNITAISYSTSTQGDAATNANFTVKCGTTAVTAFTNFIPSTGFTTVYTPAVYTHSIGLNTITFNTPYNWDGVSNLVVEVSHDGINSINNAQTYYTATAGNMLVFSYNANATGTPSTNRLNIIFNGQAQTQSAGALTWQWNPGALNSSTVTVNPVNTGTTATTASYTVTATDPMSTCTNTAVVSVTVNPVPAIPTAVNSVQCGVAVPTASVSGGTSYNWYATPTSTTVIQSGTSQTYTTSINTTTSFYVSSFNGNCESPRAMLTASVNVPDAITATPSATAICPGQSFTLTAANTGTTNVYSYTWTATPAAGSGIATSATGASVSVSPTASGNYTYLLTGVDGACTSTTSVNVLTNASPVIVATATPSMMCSGSTATLNAVTSAVSSGTAIVGTQSSVNFIGGPYRGGSAADDKAQWLFTAAELNAAGIFAGNITSLSFNNTTAGSVALPNFTIRMGTTATTALTGVYDAAPPIVVGPITYTAVNGVNTHTFAPFFWNGTSNIVIQACHDNTNILSMNVDMATISNRTLYSSVAGACAQASGTSVAYRPVIRFGAQVGTQSAGSMTWQWNPGAINSNTTTVSPTTSTTPIMPSYTVTAIDPATTCSNTAVVTITVNPVPTVSVAASTGSICSGSTASLTATGAATYSWMPAGGTSSVAVVSPAATTVYTVTGTTAGCSNTQTVNLNVSPSPTVVASVSPSVICAGATVSLTASGATTYSWMPNSTSSGTTTATPSVSTTYTVTGTTAGCTNTKTLSVTVNNVPTVTVTSNPSALCTTGATATLTAAGTSTAYAWNTGATTATTAVAPTVTTVYTVTGTNSCGVRTVTTTVMVATTPTIAAMASSSIICAGNTAVLTASATPGVTYSWNTGAGTTSISVSPSVTTTYSVTGTNACGSAVATVVQNVSPCIGIEEIGGGSEISIYPNPASDYVSIAVPANLVSANTTVEVTDAIGKLVIKETINTDVTTLRISKLEDGVYFFKIITNNQTVKVGKVVKH